MLHLPQDINAEARDNDGRNGDTPCSCLHSLEQQETEGTDDSRQPRDEIIDESAGEWCAEDGCHTHKTEQADNETNQMIQNSEHSIKIGSITHVE